MESQVLDRMKQMRKRKAAEDAAKAQPASTEPEAAGASGTLKCQLKLRWPIVQQMVVMSYEQGRSSPLGRH